MTKFDIFSRSKKLMADSCEKPSSFKDYANWVHNKRNKRSLDPANAHDVLFTLAKRGIITPEMLDYKPVLQRLPQKTKNQITPLPSQEVLGTVDYQPDNTLVETLVVPESFTTSPEALTPGTPAQAPEPLTEAVATLQAPQT